jgi:gas vesicle protein
MIDTLIKANLPLLKTVFIAGAVAGVAVGGTVGIGVGYVMGTLLAAKSGEELRDDIANKVMDFANCFTGRPSSES